MPGRETASAPQFFADAAAFRAWLEAHGGTARELLVGFHKVGSGLPSLTWPESVDEALCFGWIDGVRRRLDERSYCIRFSPRRPGSNWSAVNVARFEALRAAGRVEPAGLAAFARRLEAKTAVYSYDRAAEPELTAAERARLAADPAALAFFETVAPSYRRAVVHWVTGARRPETRERRFARLLASCAAGERLMP